MRLARGATRTVVLTRRLAIKLPGAWTRHPRHWWKGLLEGLLANLQERDLSQLSWHQFCPVLWSAPGGFLVVMPRAQPLDRQSDLAFDRVRFFADRGCGLISEWKPDNYGIFEGRIVAVDYG